MIIKNKTNGKILSENAVKAKTYKQRAFGLLLAKKAATMIFQTRFGIHTLFMKYPIDVLVLDKENKIAALKRDLKPNRIFVWNIKHDTIIELPAGIIQNSSSNIGDQILVTT